jgi:hypothetical protein
LSIKSYVVGIFAVIAASAFIVLFTANSSALQYSNPAAVFAAIAVAVAGIVWFKKTIK